MENQETIDSIESFPVVIDVTGVKANKTYSINLTKPTGIREISVKTLTVELEVDDIVSKDIPAVPINAVNLESGYTVQVVGEQNRTVTVIVNGSDSAVNSIDASTINAYVDSNSTKTEIFEDLGVLISSLNTEKTERKQIE